jgi:hypothetical protein
VGRSLPLLVPSDRRRGWLLPLLVLAVAIPAWVEAQDAPARWDAALVAGVHGTDPELHLFGGLEARLRLAGRAGGRTLALRGSGRSYTSTLVALGPSVRLPLGSRSGQGAGPGIEAWGGPAWYGEHLEAPEGPHLSRGALVGLAGISLRVPVWKGTVSAGLVHWRGSVSDEGFATPGPLAGTRFMLGVGR